MKMSHTTSRRSSALSPAPAASDPGLLCAADPAASIVIPLALSIFCERTPAPLRNAGPSAAGISASFSVTSAFLCALCVKCFPYLSTACPQNRQFLFDTNEPLPNFLTHTKQTTSFPPFDSYISLARTLNHPIHTKQTTSLQNTSFFLFTTNERPAITTHQSLITIHRSLITRHRSLISNSLPRGN